MKPETLLAGVGALFLAATLFSHTVTLRLWLLAAGIVLAAITVSRRRDEIRALPPIWLPFALWALWAALSLTWSIEPERSQKEWRNEVFYSGAALWICYLGAQAPKAARLFLPVLAAAAAGACLVGLRDFSLGWERYLHGLHGGPGNHSSALLTLMPCVVMAGWYGRQAGWPQWRLALCAALALLFLAGAYATLNRTIWLGFGVQAALIGSFLLILGRTAWSARARAWTGASALIIAAGTATVVLNIQAARESVGGSRAFTSDLRFALWPEILERISERPLTGYGFGRGLLRNPLQQELGATDNLWHAHNLFLEALLQTGVPGILLLGCLLAAIALAGWRIATGSDAAAAACGIALLGVVAGMLVRNMTDTLLVRQNALLFWGVTGVLLGLAAQRRARGAERS